MTSLLRTGSLQRPVWEFGLPNNGKPSLFPASTTADVRDLEINQLESDVARLIYEGSAITDFAVDELIDPVIAGWLEFLKLDPNVKDQWCVDRETKDPQGPDTGYIRRSKEARHGAKSGSYDEKQFFHYTASVPYLLRIRNVDTTAQTMWLAALSTLLAACTEKLCEIMKVVDRQMPGFHLYDHVCDPAAQVRNTLRLLCYKQAEVAGDEIAKDHPDRNLLTLHLDESCRGLIVRNGAEVSLYEKQANKILMFSSSKAEVLTKGRLRRCWHGVSAHTEAVGKQRWSIVFFGHSNTPYDFH